MSVNSEYYYYSSIRRYTKLMGYVISNIKIKRNDALICVPIRQSNGNSYSKIEYANNDRRDTENSKRYKAVYPSIGYRLTSITYGRTRQTNTNNQIFNKRVDNNSNVNSQLNRVPYDFRYTVDIRCKNMDDMLQIVEQLLPRFDPEIKITIEDIDNDILEVKQSIDIELENIEGIIDNSFDDFENDNSRFVDCSIDFILKGYLYKMTNSSPVVTNTVLSVAAIDEIDLTKFEDIQDEVVTYENEFSTQVDIGLHDSVIKKE